MFSPLSDFQLLWLLVIKTNICHEASTLVQVVHVVQFQDKQLHSQGMVVP